MKTNNRLLLVTEGGVYPGLPQRIGSLGYEVTLETTARRAMAQLNAWQPDVLVADFYKRYFHDRVSNLESLLAVAARHASIRIVVLYDPFHAADLELLKQRHRIDVTLPLPVSAAALQAALGPVQESPAGST